MWKWQVFVSSSPKGRHAAELIIEVIKQAGLSSVFSSDYDISPGYPWPQQIENAIISSQWGFPRIPATNTDPQQLRSEIARLVEAMSRSCRGH
jgi:hypothetical protein